ncbi:MAG: hypothetical protein JSR81_17350 [Proteobacteria bacterium]|nr:hypothetical protein [Pseudomonadota bacterium]
MRRRLPAMILSACAFALPATSALAANPPPVAARAPLAPGGAAGVHAAQMKTPNTAVWIAGGAILVGGLALALSGGGHHGHGPSTTTTGTTGTTGTSGTN